MGKGFLSRLIKRVMPHSDVQTNKETEAKPDPYRAAGAVFGEQGAWSDSDTSELGAVLGAMGAFDDCDDGDEAHDDLDDFEDDDDDDGSDDDDE